MVYIIGADLREHRLFDARFRVTRQKRQGNFDADAEAVLRGAAAASAAIRLAAEPSACTSIAPSIPRPWTSSPWRPSFSTPKARSCIRASSPTWCCRSATVSVRNRELQLSNRQDAPSSRRRSRARSRWSRTASRPAEIVKVSDRQAQRLRHDHPTRETNLPGQKGPMKSSIAVFLSVDAGAAPLSADVVQAVRAPPRRAGAHVASRVWQDARGSSLELDISENTARASARSSRRRASRGEQLVSGCCAAPRCSVATESARTAPAEWPSSSELMMMREPPNR